ncbi:MAG: hypothetical protein AAF376_07060 [Pseudomonadota bacterium]
MPDLEAFHTAAASATAVPHRVRPTLYINLLNVSDFYQAENAHCDAVGVPRGSWVVNMTTGGSHLLSPTEGSAFCTVYQRWIASHFVTVEQRTEPVQ